MVEVFQNARLDGKVGVLVVTDEDVTHVESNSLKQSKSEFSVAHIKELVTGSSSKSVELKLELGDIKDSVLLEFMSLPDVDRLCRRLNEKIQQRATRSSMAAATSSPETVTKVTVTEPQSSALTDTSKPTTDDVVPSAPEKNVSPMVGAIPSTTPLPRKGVRHSIATVPIPGGKAEPPPPVGAFSSTAPLPRKGVRHSTMTMPNHLAREGEAREPKEHNHAEPEKAPQVGAFSSTAALPRKGARQSMAIMPLAENAGEDARKVKKTESGMSAGVLSSSSDDGDYAYLEDDGEFGEEGAESEANASSRHANPLMQSVKAEMDESLKTALEPSRMSVRQRSCDEVDATSEQAGSTSSIPDTCARRISQVRRESQRNMMDSSSRRRRESQRMSDSSTPGATSVRGANQVLKDSSARRRERRESQKTQSHTKCEKEMDSSSMRHSSRRRRESQKNLSMSVSSTSDNLLQPEMSDASAHRVTMNDLERQHREQEKTRSFTLTTTNTSAQTSEHAAGNDAALQAKKAMLAAPAKPLNKTEESNDLEVGSAEVAATVSTGMRPSRSAQDLLAGNNLVEAMLVESDEFDKGPSIIASAVDVDQEIQQQKKFRMRIACACLLAIIAIIVLSILAATNAFGSDSDGEVSIPELTPEERFAIMKERIAKVVYDNASLDNVNSPQSMALNWLAREDSLYNDVTNVDIELQEKVINRYFLAVFYFSMTGGSASKWRHCHPPETGESNACVHPLLESYAIDGIYYNQNMREASFRWLSEGDECAWAGVSCFDGVHVSRIHLAGYGLSGTLPAEIGQLDHLQILDLQQNKLQGSLPLEWGILGLPALKTLRLDQNNFQGGIPREWCSLGNTTHLQDLILANNALTGTLPSCLSKLAGLEDFSVMNNAMTGQLPSGLGDLSELRRLHLAGNGFNGKLPGSVCDLVESRMLSETSTDCMNSASESYVQCPCCTTCCDGNERGSCQSGGL